MRLPTRGLVAATAALALFIACVKADPAGTPRRNVGSDSGPGEGEGWDDPGTDFTQPRTPDFVDTDSGAFPVASRARDGGPEPTTTGDGGGDDAGSDAAVPACPGPLAAGDLAVVEVMVASQPGSGDRGEWVEVQSQRDCALDLSGVRVTSPRGTAVDAAEIPAGVILPPRGSFVVSGSLDAALNHGLPGLIFAFAGEPGDVLRNGGDTVTISAAAVTVDTFTYPPFNPQAGRSVAFPSDCTASDRANFPRWSYTFDSYGTGVDGGTLLGTPNAPNDDVTCF